MIDPRLVKQAVDALEQHPDAELDITSMPAGTDKAIHAEISRRMAAKKADASVNSASDELDSAAEDRRTRSQLSPLKQGLAEAGGALVRGMDPQNPSALGAALYGSQNALTLGHGDEIQGLLQSLAGDGDYESNRDMMRTAAKNSADQHPIPYYGANAVSSMALPVKSPELGIPIGAASALGYSDKDLSDPTLPQDIEAGGAVGGALGTVASAAGKGVGWIAGKAGKSADRLLMNALGLTSEELDALKANASMKDLLDVVRRNGGPMSGARDISESISNEAGVGQKGMPIAFPGRGEQVPVEQPSAAALAGKPEQYSGSTTAQELPGVGQFNQRSLDQAFEQSYRPKTVPADIYDPAVPPVPPVPQPPPTPYEGPQVSSMQQAQPALGGVQRLAVQKLNKIHDASGSSLLAPKGMPASTFQGGVVSAVMARSGLPLAITGKKMAQAISDYVKVSGAGLPAAMQARVNAMVDQVMQSPDPEFTDYLAKETLPEYLAISLEVDKQDHTPGAADAGQ